MLMAFHKSMDKINSYFINLISEEEAMKLTSMTTKLVLTFGVMLCIDGHISVGHAQWHKAYKAGLQAMKRQNWQVAAQYFEEALKKKNQDKKKIRASGVMFIAYYPHRELGICYYNLGLITRAKKELALSLRQAPSKRTKKYIDRILRGDYPKRPGGTPFTPPKQQVTPPAQPLPAQLSASHYFVEPSNNGFLDAGEEGKLIVELSNSGRGDADGLQVKLSPQTDISGVSIGSASKIEHLHPGDKKSVAIPISTSQNVSSKQITLKIDVSEANGFDLDPPAYITFNTRSFVPPKLTIADIGIADYSMNKQIEPREIVDITARIQNMGPGEAHNVIATVLLGANVFLTPDSKTEFALGDLHAGDFRDIVFGIFTNSRATSVPIKILLKEAQGRYDETLPLDLPFNKPLKKAHIVDITGTESGPIEIPNVAELTSDVDKNIPNTSMTNTYAIAVVIGNRDYKNQDVPTVDFAEQDANAIKQYLIKTLGYREGNIIFVTDATQAEFNGIFGTGSNHKGKLYNWVRPNKSDVFVYYSGHGAPDPDSKDGYFVPSDCDPSLVALNGYSLDTFYGNLAKIPYKSLTVVVDACFSGASERGLLLKNVSPIFIKPKNPLLSIQNSIVFTSSTGDEVSSWYPEKKHSLFTYYFLKSLQGEADSNQDNNLTVGEIKNYIDDNVPYMARRLNNRTQTPQFNGKPNVLMVKY